MHRTMKAAIAAVACAFIAAPAYSQTIDKIRQSGAITVGHRDASIPRSRKSWTVLETTLLSSGPISTSSKTSIVSWVDVASPWVTWMNSWTWRR